MNGQKPVERKSNNFSFDLWFHIWIFPSWSPLTSSSFPSEVYPSLSSLSLLTTNRYMYNCTFKKNLIAYNGGEKFLTNIFLFIGRCAGCMHNIHNVHIAYCIICSSANIPAIPLQSNRKGINFTKPGDGGGNHSCCTRCKQYLINIQLESRQITHRTWFATKMMMANDGG